MRHPTRPMAAAGILGALVLINGAAMMLALAGPVPWASSHWFLLGVCFGLLSGAFGAVESASLPWRRAWWVGIYGVPAALSALALVLGVWSRVGIPSEPLLLGLWVLLFLLLGIWLGGLPLALRWARVTSSPMDLLGIVFAPADLANIGAFEAKILADGGSPSTFFNDPGVLVRLADAGHEELVLGIIAEAWPAKRLLSLALKTRGRMLLKISASCPLPEALREELAKAFGGAPKGADKAADVSAPRPPRADRTPVDVAG